jgi:hypothetical protein
MRTKPKRTRKLELIINLTKDYRGLKLKWIKPMSKKSKTELLMSIIIMIMNKMMNIMMMKMTIKVRILIKHLYIKQSLDKK